EDNQSQIQKRNRPIGIQLDRLLKSVSRILELSLRSQLNAEVVVVGVETVFLLRNRLGGSRRLRGVFQEGRHITRRVIEMADRLKLAPVASRIEMRRGADGTVGDEFCIADDA